MADQMYWTVVLNEIAYTPTAASGIYEKPEEAHAAVAKLWADGKEAAVVPLLAPRLNASYRAGQLDTYSSVMNELADEMAFVGSDSQGTIIRIENETYRTLRKNRTETEAITLTAAAGYCAPEGVTPSPRLGPPPEILEDTGPFAVRGGLRYPGTKEISE